MEAAKRLDGITYAIRDVIAASQELEKQGRTILKLNIGDPNAYDFDTPDYVKKALHEAIESKLNGYADSQGFLRLRQAIVAQNHRRGFDSTTENVVVSSGLSEAVNFTYASLLNPGDEVMSPSPTYPQYEALAKFYGAKNTYYELVEENGFLPDVDDLRKHVTAKTKAIVLINPNNPTGSLLPEKEVRKLLDFAGEHGLVVMADEIYSEMVFDETAVAAASLSKDVPIIAMNGLSKNFLAPGWRMGWVTFCNFPDDNVKKAFIQLCRLRLSASYPVEYASAVALENTGEYEPAKRQMLEKLRRRRDLAFKRLNEIPGISCVKPGGAFYAFPQIHDEKNVFADDKQFVYDLLAEHGVLTVFGSGFAEKPGSKHFRIVFLPPEETLEKAFGEIEKFMRKRGFA
jgi:aspartate/methionine/tyrosine aminotransferase